MHYSALTPLHYLQRNVPHAERSLVSLKYPRSLVHIELMVLGDIRIGGALCRRGENDGRTDYINKLGGLGGPHWRVPYSEEYDR